MFAFIRKHLVERPQKTRGQRVGAWYAAEGCRWLMGWHLDPRAARVFPNHSQTEVAINRRELKHVGIELCDLQNSVVQNQCSCPAIGFLDQEHMKDVLLLLSVLTTH